LFITTSDKIHGEKSTKFHIPSYDIWYNYFKVRCTLHASARKHTHTNIYT